MRSIGIAVVLLVGTWTMGVGLAAADDVMLLDDCKPNAYWPSCLLEEGDVTQAEFTVERGSPNALAVIGH